jgi:hypothetical protein
MATQNYSNHRQFVPIFHFVLLPVLLLTAIGSIVNLTMSWGDHQRLYSAALIVVLCLCLMILSITARVFALKAQDRAIRAEENLLDPRLGTGQVVALRFAADGEFVPLARRAAEESMKPDAIKRAVKNWREDTYRA